MLTLGSRNSRNALAPPSRWRYRLTRFLLSKTYWFVTRILLPLTIIAIAFYQLWTAQSIRNFITDTRHSIFETIAYLPMFEVNEIRIENATKLQEDEVRTALDVELPTSSLIVDREALREKMTSIDAIGEASIRFNYRGVMDVVLAPRIPAMIYFDGVDFIAVDKEGYRVEKLTSRADRPNLFVISGKGARDAMFEAQKVMKMIEPFADRVRGLVRVGERRWDVVLINGGRLMLPAESAFEAIHLVLLQHKASDVLNRDIRAYDMRIPKRPILRMNPKAIEEIERLKQVGSGQSV